MMNSIVELIAQIKKRPAMYLGRNYISCFKAFLDGWYLRNPETVVDADVMNGFQSWVEAKYQVSSSHSWCDIILFNSQDEKTALVLFFADFDEWLRSSVD